jgi:hypothetical protein
VLTAQQAHLHGAAEAVGGGFEDRAGRRAARVVDEDMHGSGQLEVSGGAFADGFGIVEVGLEQSMGLSGGMVEHVADHVQGVLVAGQEHQFRAAPGDLDRAGPPDAL